MKFIKQKPDKAQPRLFSSVNRLPRAVRREAVLHVHSIQASTFNAGQEGNSEMADPVQKANQDSTRSATRTSEQVLRRVGSTVSGGQKKLFKRFRYSSSRQNTNATVRATKASAKNSSKIYAGNGPICQGCNQNRYSSYQGRHKSCRHNSKSSRHSG